jgi:hypothetical protein
MIYSSLEFDWSEKKKLALYHDIVSTKNAGLGVKFVDWCILVEILETME